MSKKERVPTDQERLVDAVEDYIDYVTGRSEPVIPSGYGLVRKDAPFVWLALGILLGVCLIYFSRSTR